MLKVVQPFKCRHHNNKVFKVDEEYNSVNKKHTEKLIEEKYIKEHTPKKTTVKQKVTKEKTDKK